MEKARDPSNTISSILKEPRPTLETVNCRVRLAGVSTSSENRMASELRLMEGMTAFPLNRIDTSSEPLLAVTMSGNPSLSKSSIPMAVGTLPTA